MSVMEMPAGVAHQLQVRGAFMERTLGDLEQKLEWLKDREEAFRVDLEKIREHLQVLAQEPDTLERADKLAQLRALAQQRETLHAKAVNRIAQVQAAISSCLGGQLSGLGADAVPTTSEQIAAALPGIRQVASQLTTKKGRQALLKSAITPPPPPEPEEKPSTGWGWWLAGLAAIGVGGYVLMESLAKRSPVKKSENRAARRRRRYSLA